MNLQLFVNVIEEAIWHGADPGGSYDQNMNKLENAIKKFLKQNEISDVKIIFDKYDGFHGLIDIELDMLYLTSYSNYPDGIGEFILK